MNTTREREARSSHGLTPSDTSRRINPNVPSSFPIGMRDFSTIADLFLKVGLLPPTGRPENRWRLTDEILVKVPGLRSGLLLATDGVQGIIKDGDEYHLVHATDKVKTGFRRKQSLPSSQKQSKAEKIGRELLLDLLS